MTNDVDHVPARLAPGPLDDRAHTLGGPGGDEEVLDGPGGGPRPSSYARCSDGAGTLSALFFSDVDEDIARARAICRTCGLADACRRGAIERREPHGVWGGTLLVDGVPVLAKRRRGRPPKHRPAPIEVDEVPLPPWVA